ncbi:MAG: DUF4270 domain-containing protein [Saprospiraceae bacterium]|nr:DUF4270 domain-containing protein [Saprospiraceae bacterium]
MNFFYTTLICLIISLYSCQDPTQIGADLFEDDFIFAEFTDTIGVNAGTIIGDTLKVYDPNLTLTNTYLLGNYLDPTFGSTRSSIYTQFGLNTFNPDFTDAILDSVVLKLSYDTLGFYGDTLRTFSINVYQLSEDMDNTQTYYSNQTFGYFPTPIGQKYNILATPKTNISGLIEGVDTITQAPHLRVKLDNSFGQYIMNLDSASLSTTNNFIQKMKGLYLTVGTPSGVMVGTSLLSSLTGITLYYRQNDIAKTYKLSVSSTRARVMNFQNNYTGTATGNALQNTTLTDSLLYLQGTEGTFIKVKIPDIRNLANKGYIVNKALLSFTAKSPENTEKYHVIKRLLASIKTTDGLKIIDDLNLASTISLSIFGGTATSATKGSDNVYEYEMNISNHIQSMIDGSESDELYITAASRLSTASRSIFYGKSGKYPIKLKLYLSKK